MSSLLAALSRASTARTTATIEQARASSAAASVR
jgi:hypothetical protein